VDSLRPLYIRSVWQDVECGACGAHVTINTEHPTEPDPYAHEDDCPRAEMADPR